jgi:dolichol-phosphate mannosyltransferase
MLYERIAAVVQDIPGTWEFIFVDDGSDDGSMEALTNLRRIDDRVKIVRFSRNFGSHIAISAGLDYASGDAAIVITSDLQEPPESIPAFIEAWRAGYEIVWGVREIRSDSVFSRWASRAYWRIFKSATGLRTFPEEGVGGLFLLDRKVLRVLRQFRERNRQLGGILAWMGFRHIEIPYRQSKRYAGGSKWSFGDKIKLAIDSLISFSYIPIRLMIYLGLLASMSSFAYAILLIASKLVAKAEFPVGWPTVVASILFLGGVQLIMLGVLGEYLWRNLEEARQRPLYIVTETIGFADVEADTPGSSVVQCADHSVLQSLSAKV